MSKAPRPISRGKQLAWVALMALPLASPLVIAGRAVLPASPHDGQASSTPHPVMTSAQDKARPTPTARRRPYITSPEPHGVVPESGAMALLASSLVLLGRLAHRLDPVGTTV